MGFEECPREKGADQKQTPSKRTVRRARARSMWKNRLGILVACVSFAFQEAFLTPTPTIGPETPVNHSTLVALVFAMASRPLPS